MPRITDPNPTEPFDPSELQTPIWRAYAAWEAKAGPVLVDNLKRDVMAYELKGEIGRSLTAVTAKLAKATGLPEEGIRAFLVDLHTGGKYVK